MITYIEIWSSADRQVHLILHLVWCHTCFCIALLPSAHIYFGCFILLASHWCFLLQLVSQLPSTWWRLQMYVLVLIYFTHNNLVSSLSYSSPFYDAMVYWYSGASSDYYYSEYWRNKAWFSWSRYGYIFLVIWTIDFLEYLTMKQETLFPKDASISWEKKISSGQRWKQAKFSKACEKQS